MFTDEQRLKIRTLVVQADFEEYDAQPEHIRYIMREHGVSVEIAEMIYKEETTNA